ncbi:hypothetical protein Y59_12700 [Enterobacter hormaechei]|nr:hypothetical protein Y59_12700 [Enterobacter hormaechei]
MKREETKRPDFKQYQTEKRIAIVSVVSFVVAKVAISVFRS